MSLSYEDIADMPSVLDVYGSRWHESVFRSYQILAKVKWLLEQGTQPQVVRELIVMMEKGKEKEVIGEKVPK